MLYQPDLNALLKSTIIRGLNSFLLSLLIYSLINAILVITYPPRLSGFDREAQPWWVFYACHLGLFA